MKIFILTLAFLCFMQSFAEQSFNKIACENDRAVLECTGGRTVRVTHANYGRTAPDSQVCPYGRAHREDTNCIMDNSFNLLSRRCNHRHICGIDATNEILREDPCGGTYKYLNITYTCETQGLRLAATCDNNMTLYFNGIEQTFSSLWHRPSYLNIPQEAQIVGIECANTGGFGGIVTTFSDGSVSGSDGWTCSNQYEEGWNEPGFDDSDWDAAVAKAPPKNRGTARGMSETAQWIWTNDTLADRDTHVYCRHQVKSDSYCTFFDSVTEAGNLKVAAVFWSACMYQSRVGDSDSAILASVKELKDFYLQVTNAGNDEVAVAFAAPVQLPVNLQEVNQDSSKQSEGSTGSDSSGESKQSQGSKDSDNSSRAEFLRNLKEKVQGASSKARAAWEKLRAQRNTN